jgi:signal transduction histidine kinase
VYRIFGVLKGVFHPTLDSYSELIHLDDRMMVSRALGRSEPGSEDYSYEPRIVRPDGEIRTIRVVALADTDEGGELSGRAVTIQDITEQSKAEKQLRQAMKMEAVGRLTGGIAHDFNNLMTIVKINLSMLQDKKYSGLQPQLVTEALEACQRGASLTHRLLAYSRSQTLQPVSADLNEVMTGILNLLERTLGAHISIETLSSPSLARVMIDVNELETALINLATNARDAMLDGGELSIGTANVTLDAVEAERRKVDAGHYVELSVSDTGSGIAEDIIDEISEPFFTTKDVGEGSGLGLSMVQGFVTQSGGHMTIKSAPDQGTKVSILLPAIAEAPPIGATKEGADHPRGSSEKPYDQALLAVRIAEMIGSTGPSAD